MKCLFGSLTYFNILRALPVEDKLSVSFKVSDNNHFKYGYDC
ncbi:hypothetical protein JCM19314_3662 [Nonlabens ulvanivorans]|uniref:Uncharacterized protein n=1 Tax=Nonlabens ulvanivorans TaxID=906888 RepID=A0A090QBM3_NONUL|nr:hypothetical protein JCM19314_3662 [Nonlabens ulvanivorans]